MNDEIDYQPSPRVCQRGRDGSASCGHEENASIVGADICLEMHANGSSYCAHPCDFSPEAEKVEKDIRPHIFQPSQNHTQLCCYVIKTVTDENGLQEFYACTQPESAPVHKVESKPPRYVEDCPCHQNGNCSLGVCGSGLYHHDECQFVTPTQSIPPPRVWIGLEHGRVYSEMCKGTVQYAHLEPIQKALKACEAGWINNPDDDGYDIRKSDWEALVTFY